MRHHGASVAGRGAASCQACGGTGAVYVLLKAR
jgi:hypothetical protein